MKTKDVIMSEKRHDVIRLETKSFLSSLLTVTPAALAILYTPGNTKRKAS